jgi:DNA polymerase IV
LARRLQHEIRARTGLAEAAYGIAATRLMARVMARQARHDRQDRQVRSMGIRICPPGREAELLAPLEPSVLPGLSPQCRERIRRYALASIRQIQALGRAALFARFGAEGDKLHTLASGLDLAPAAAPPPGIRVETVLAEDLNDDDALFRKVRLTADKLAFRLRQEGATAAKIVVSIRYSDHKSVRKTLKAVPATDAYKELAELALAGFRDLHVRRVALKAIALTVSQPGIDKGQVDLFEELRDRKARALGDALTRIRGRSGFAVIGAAGS